MNYTDKTADYIEGFYSEDARFAPITEYAREHGIPIMKPLVAKLIETLVTAKKPERILEIGTAIGYSGTVMLICCDGTLTTVEKDEDSFLAARSNFSSMGLQSRVTQLLGDANEEIGKIEGIFDFIFLDGPKAQYVRILPELMSHLSIGGMLVADNVMYRGQISGEERRVRRMRTIVKRLREFLEEITSDERLTSCVLPFADGVSVSVRVK